jgi:hypothetical protein
MFTRVESPKVFRLVRLLSKTTLMRNTGPNPLDNSGNVDFVSADEDIGLVFVADGVGHDYATAGLPARQRDRMNDIWQRFAVSMRERLSAANDGLHIDTIGSIVYEGLQAASGAFSGIGKSSTFSGAVLLASAESEYDSRRWVLTVGIADSGIVVLKKDGRAVALTSFNDRILRNIEIGGDIRAAELKLHLVDSGDVVLGLTDGTLDAMAVAGSVGSSCGVSSLSHEPGRWMEACLLQIQAAAGLHAEGSASAGAARADAPLGELLERLFEAALQATNANPLLIQPDDAASFAFTVQ